MLAAAVEAMGGAAKFDALESFYSEATLNTGALGLTGTAKTWWRGGDFYNESGMPGVGRSKIGRLADKVWGNNPISGLRALSDKEAQAMWSASLCLAHDWRRYFKTVSGPKAAVEGRQEEVLDFSLTTPLGDVVMLRLDAETKLPVSQSFSAGKPARQHRNDGALQGLSRGRRVEDSVPAGAGRLAHQSDLDDRED